MNFSDLEDKIYDLAALSYKIGRVETDGSTSQKKYDKLVEERDNLMNEVVTAVKMAGKTTKIGT
jgi:hypothetical protein